MYRACSAPGETYATDEERDLWLVWPEEFLTLPTSSAEPPLFALLEEEFGTMPHADGAPFSLPIPPPPPLPAPRLALSPSAAEEATERLLRCTDERIAPEEQDGKLAVLDRNMWRPATSPRTTKTTTISTISTWAETPRHARPLFVWKLQETDERPLCCSGLPLLESWDPLDDACADVDPNQHRLMLWWEKTMDTLAAQPLHQAERTLKAAELMRITALVCAASDSWEMRDQLDHLLRRSYIAKDALRDPLPPSAHVPAPDDSTFSREHPVFLAAAKGWYYPLRTLLAYGAPALVFRSGGSLDFKIEDTALAAASHNGHAHVARLLLLHKPHPFASF